jgi:hypothetical protein
MNLAWYGNLEEELEALDTRVNAFLPPRYQHCYTSVSPNSMGSAGLSYGPDGRVLWDQIWTSFCDLALAGGPPHRGSLLEPVSEADVAANPALYSAAVAEIGRAIGLTTGLRVVDGYAPGWVGVECECLEQAAWLQFAITAENVSARRRRIVLQLPVGPAFRVEKEIKNVVVALAKAYHYWDGHLTATQQSLAADGVREPASPDDAAASPAEYEARVAQLESDLREAGVPLSPRRYIGWVGVDTRDEEDAVWLLRAVLVERILARREGKVVYLPVAATPDLGDPASAGRAFRRAWELRTASTPRRPAWRPSGRS